MRILTSFPVQGFSGSTKASGVVYSVRGGCTIASARPGPPPPPTSDQELLRTLMQEATRAWAGLACEVRAAWQSYAQRYLTQNHRREEKAPDGKSAYVGCAMQRAILGLEFPQAAPLEPPPMALWDLTLQPSSAPGEFVVGLSHGLGDKVSGLVVQVRLTPATASPARKPRPNQARLICGIGPQSAAALVPDGQAIRFSQARFAIAAGERFGLEAKLVRTSDGVAGKALFCDLLRSQTGEAQILSRSVLA